MEFHGLRFTEEQVDSLLVQCDELAGLLSIWGRQCEEIRRSVHDLSLLAGVEPRPCPAAAQGAAGPAAARSAPSQAADRGAGAEEDCGDDLGDVDFFIPAKKIDFASRLGINGSSGSRGRDLGEDQDPSLADEKSSNSSDSSSFNIDVDESWAQRFRDLESALEDGADGADMFDDPIIRAPSVCALLGFRTGPHLLERIEEGPQEDAETSSDCRSSGPSDGPASARSSRDSSLERAWANVPEAGFAPATLQEQPAADTAGGSGGGAAEAQRGRQSPRPADGREAKRKRPKEPRATAYEAKPFGNGISKVVASFRTNFRILGPKEEGPLSRIQEKDMETE